MNNEDAQAIKHAVADAIMAAQRICPHCGTPWTLWQRRGYDKHPCDEWRNDPAPMSDAEREWRKRLDHRCLCDQPHLTCQVHKRATGHPSASTRHCVHDCENGIPSPLCKVHGHYWD